MKNYCIYAKSMFMSPYRILSNFHNFISEMRLHSTTNVVIEVQHTIFKQYKQVSHRNSIQIENKKPKRKLILTYLDCINGVASKFVQYIKFN